MTASDLDHIAREDTPSFGCQSDLVNALTVIIGSAQAVRRAEEFNHPLKLEQRMDRIGAAARQIALLFLEPRDDILPLSDRD